MYLPDVAERYREKGGATNKKGEGTAGKYVYTMHEVTKFIGHDRPLFKDVTLSFFEGYRSELMRLLTTHRAKIGIIGVNGTRSLLVHLTASR